MEAAVGIMPFSKTQVLHPTQLSPVPASPLPRASGGCLWPDMGGRHLLADLTTVVPHALGLQ